MAAEIKHSSHVHPLRLIERPNYPYYCSSCNQLGFGATYTCKSNPPCNFLLHKECAKASRRADHPFSEKCKLELRNASPTGRHPCDACGKTVRGPHYKCLCSFTIRYLHPFCLNYNRRLEASDGLTLNLSKTATSRCLHCHKKDLGWDLSGWAYVSACGNYCYHVACVTNIINDRWKDPILNRECDPSLVFKESIPNLQQMNQIVRARRAKTNLKTANALISIIFHTLTGNPLGLIGAAVEYFGSK